MMQEIKDGIRALVPPANGADPRAWRLNVFLALVMIITVLAFHLLSTSGTLGFMGIEGVARAGEVQIIDARSKAILKAIYSPQIRAKIRERCDTNDAHLRERINTELDRLLGEYRSAAGEPFGVMPNCSQV